MTTPMPVPVEGTKFLKVPREGTLPRGQCKFCGKWIRSPQYASHVRNCATKRKETCVICQKRMFFWELLTHECKEAQSG